MRKRRSSSDDGELDSQYVMIDLCGHITLLQKLEITYQGREEGAGITVGCSLNIPL